MDLTRPFTRENKVSNGERKRDVNALRDGRRTCVKHSPTGSSVARRLCILEDEASAAEMGLELPPPSHVATR